MEKELSSTAKTKELEIQQQLIQVKAELDKINSLFEKTNPRYSRGLLRHRENFIESYSGKSVKGKKQV